MEGGFHRGERYPVDTSMIVPRKPWHHGSVPYPAPLSDIPRAEAASFIQPALCLGCAGVLIIWHANEPGGLTWNMGNDDFTGWIQGYLPAKIFQPVCWESISQPKSM